MLRILELLQNSKAVIRFKRLDFIEMKLGEKQ